MDLMIHTQRFRLTGLAVAFLLIMPPLASAQTAEDALRFSERLTATSVRAMGVGGATIGGFADYNALFSNPAGLGYISTSLLSGSLNNLEASNESLYSVPGFRNETTSNVTNTRLGSIGYVYSFPTTQGAFTFGVAYNRTNTFERDLRFQGENASSSITEFFLPFSDEYSIDVEPGGDGELNTDDDTFFPAFTRGLSLIGFETFAIDLDADAFLAGDPNPFLPAVQPGTTILQDGRLTETGGMNELSFGGAIEAARNLMVGVSVNVLFGKYDLRNEFSEDDFRNENDGEFGSTDFDFLRYTQRLETEIVGVNLRAGLSSNVTKDLRIGLSLETPSYYVMDEQFSTRLETAFDNGDRFVYGDDFNEDAESGEFEYEITSPWRFGIGATYSIGNLTLLGDMEFVDWSQLEFRLGDIDVAFRDQFERENQNLQDNYESVVNTRFGVEYGIGDFIVRAGFGQQPDPYVGERVISSNGDELDRSKEYFSLGFGYRFADDVRFDAAFMQQQFDDINIVYSEVDTPLVIDESVERNFFTIGLTIGI